MEFPSVGEIEGLKFTFQAEINTITLYVDDIVATFHVDRDNVKVFAGNGDGEPNYDQTIRIMKAIKAFAQLINYDTVALNYPPRVIHRWIGPLVTSIIRGVVPEFFQLGFAPFDYVGDGIGYEKELRLVRDILMGNRELVPELIKSLDRYGIGELVHEFHSVYWLSDRMLEQKSNQSPDSMYSILTGRGVRFPSHRMKTDMSTFIGEDKATMSITAEEMDRLTLGIPIVRADTEYWPVSRYGFGMSKGLFHDNRPQHICGTFYYLESGSNVVLQVNSSRVLIAFNKVTAMARLTDFAREKLDPTSPDIHRIISIIHDFDNQVDRGGVFPNDPIVVATYLNWSLKQDDSPLSSVRFEGLDRNYLDADGCYRDTFYALEDVYDQNICNLARFVGYDVVILTNMAGKERVVTELLDTRSQQDSFAALTRIH